VQNLDQSAESIHSLLVDMAKTEYSRQPIPNEADQTVSDFVETYLAAGPTDRARLANKVGRDSFSAESLTVYAGRMAALAVRKADSHYLQLAVAAMMLASSGADDQEFTWKLPVLHDAAGRIGQDPETIFRSVAGTDSSGSRVMQIFRWKPDQRILKHHRAVTGPEGFRYEAILGSGSR
jgi:hypothetical protein